MGLRRPIIFVAIVVSAFVLPWKIFAETPQSQGYSPDSPVPCNAEPNEAFHPLRPYPGSPCDPLIPVNREPEVTFSCGKSLNVEGTLEFPKDGAGMPRCTDGSGDVCVDRQIVFDINLDLSSASLPIIGNTEDQLDDATKVNQYLNWYLNGTTQQSEQAPLSVQNNSDVSRIINFSGPLKKLLPFDILNNIRGKTTTESVKDQYHNYIVGCRETSNLLDKIVDYLTLVFGNLSLATEVWRIPGLANNIFAIRNDPARLAHLIAVNFSLPPGENDFIDIKQIYIDKGFPEFSDDLAIIASKSRQQLENLTRFIDDFTLENAVDCRLNNDDVKRLTDIAGHAPPDPTTYDDFSKYWNDYNTWVGRIDLGFFGNRNNIFAPNYWAQLFQNVPFSSLEDIVGEVTVGLIPNQQPTSIYQTTDPSDPKAIKLTISSDAGQDSRLYFSQIKNTNALSTMLQDLANPKDLGSFSTNDGGLVRQEVDAHQGIDDSTPTRLNAAQKAACDTAFCRQNPNLCNCNNSSVVPGNSAPEPLFTSHDQRCDLKDIRINTGDTLFGKSISGTLTYTQKVRYTPGATNVPNPGGRAPFAACDDFNQCQSLQCVEWPGYPDRVCTPIASGEITIPTEARVAVFSKAPWLDKIYDTLVAANNSVLRRFLPAQSCAPNCTEEEKKQYLRQGGSTFPAAVPAGYEASSDDVQGGRATAGDKSGGGQIYFSRLGSLFDYFLGGSKENFNLQSLLRPDGAVSTTTLVSNETVDQIAARLGVPAEFIDAIWLIETGRSPGSATCDCSGGRACGPMAITEGAYNAVTVESERASLNRCQLPDAFELGARVLLHKKFCTLAGCTFDPANPTAAGVVNSDDFEVVGRYHGTNRCAPSTETQCRWGQGYSYCDAVRYIINFGTLPPAGSAEDRNLFCSQL